MIVNNPNPVTMGVSVPSSQRAALAMQGDQLISAGLSALYLFMAVMSESGAQQFTKMSDKANVTSEAQEKANEVDAVLANLVKDTDKGALPTDVLEYMRTNNVLVGGKTIDEFLVGKNKNELNKGDLKAVQSALESTSGRASDFVTQSQLQIQKVMQTYSQISNMISSLQSQLKEMNSTIIQGIR